MTLRPPSPGRLQSTAIDGNRLQSASPGRCGFQPRPVQTRHARRAHRQLFTFPFSLFTLLFALLALFPAPALAGHFDITVDPFYNDTLLRGSFGGSPVYFFLGPSPTMEKAVISFIDASEKTLDACLFDLDMPSFTQAFIGAHKRGVKVRVLLDKDNAAKAYAVADDLKQMEQLGILQLVHNRSGLMHNKFMVADGVRVWTGSYNLTRNGSVYNDNHAIVLESPDLAENYTKEWEEIAEGRHGKRFAWPTPHPEVRIGNTVVRNYFPPEDDARGAIKNLIDSATNEVVVLAFSFTDATLVEALGAAVKRGIRVLMVLDTGMSRQAAARTRQLRELGVNVRLSPGILLHHKVVVADRQTVVLGSANFSSGGFDHNDENVLVIQAPHFARAMIREALRCWRAEPYSVTKWRTQIPNSP